MKKILIPILITSTIIIFSFVIFGNLESFFSETLSSIRNHLLIYGLLSFIILALDIVLPVPSSVVMYSNGMVLGFISGAIVSLCSLLVGATIGYYLGKFTSLGFRSKDNETTNKILLEYGYSAILITRGIPILSESICIVCGYNKMRFISYFILNIIGYLPLCFLYSFFGSIGYDKNNFLISFVLSLLISLAFWFLGKKFLKVEEK